MSLAVRCFIFIFFIIIVIVVAVVEDISCISFDPSSDSDIVGCVAGLAVVGTNGMLDGICGMLPCVRHIVSLVGIKVCFATPSAVSQNVN